MHHPNAIAGSFGLSQPSIFHGAMVPRFKCDLALSSVERGSQYIGFPYLLCYVSVSRNISAMAGKSLLKTTPV